jgi:16S rRNA (cytosine1402-N4)-methyltransferase
VADLGISSRQLDDPERGFAFSLSGPLDMRMDPSRGRTAAELVARSSERALADILYNFGEERRSRAIARSIKRMQEQEGLRTTDQLRRAVVRVLGPHRAGRSDPATRTFQALRIAVNGELDELSALLGALPELLEDGAVAAIMSFHSLEDRMVKQAFASDPRLQPLSKRPRVASERERERNPRSRSLAPRLDSTREARP